MKACNLTRFGIAFIIGGDGSLVGLCLSAAALHFIGVPAKDWEWWMYISSSVAIGFVVGTITYKLLKHPLD